MRRGTRNYLSERTDRAYCRCPWNRPTSSPRRDAARYATRVGSGTRLHVRWLGGRHDRRPRWVASASDGWQDVLAGIRVIAGGFRDDAHVAAGVTAEVEHRVGARDRRHGNAGNATGGAQWAGQSIRLATIWLRDEHHQADEPNSALDRVAVPNRTLVTDDWGTGSSGAAVRPHEL